MSTHIKLTTIHGESWIMHKDNIKSVNLVNTPDTFIEQWKKDKVVIITSTEINENDGKPWQFMVSQSMQELEDTLCTYGHNIYGEELIPELTIKNGEQ